MTPAAPAKDASSSWVKKKTNIANQSEVDYKKLALVNDDLLKVCYGSYKMSSGLLMWQNVGGIVVKLYIEIVCKITPQDRN